MADCKACGVSGLLWRRNAKGKWRLWGGAQPHVCPGQYGIQTGLTDKKPLLPEPRSVDGRAADRQQREASRAAWLKRQKQPAPPVKQEDPEVIRKGLAIAGENRWT